MEFFGVIFGLFLSVAGFYVVYQHYAAPFKKLKQAKEIKQTSNELKELLENDEILQNRLETVKKEIEKNPNLTNEEKTELITDVIKQRYEETKKQ